MHKHNSGEYRYLFILYDIFLQYCGPTTESNWVIPGVLLVGAYPATQDDDETFDLLTSILKLGINKFVCLQQEVQYSFLYHGLYAVVLINVPIVSHSIDQECQKKCGGQVSPSDHTSKM